MGTTKADIVFEGRRLEAIAEAALAPHCAAVHRLGGGGIPDAAGRSGPLAGILGALSHTPEAWWVVVACDMPLVTPEAVLWLLEARTPDAVAVIPRRTEGGPQPTLALYGPGAHAALEQVSAPIQLVGRPGVISPSVPAHLDAAWINVNDPDALSALKGQ